MLGKSEIREATIAVESGVQLHWAEVGDPRGAPLVLFHGYTDSWRSFQLVMPHLSETRRVIAVDLRGHGASSAPAGDYRITTLARDVVGFLDRLGVQKASVLGHSMGSFVARRIALDHPHRVDRLVLVGSAATADNSEIRALLKEVDQLGSVVGDEFVTEFQSSCVHRRELLPEWFFRSCVATSLRTPVHVWRSALKGLIAENHVERLGTIAQPTLIIGGRHDAIFSVSEQERLAKALSRARLNLYRHAGHTPHWEQPGRFAEEVSAFLEDPVDGHSIHECVAGAASLHPLLVH